MGIVQRHPKLFDCSIDALIEFDNGVVRPEPSADLFARHQIAGSFQQQFENEERLFLKKDGAAVVVEFAGFQIKFEWAEGGDIARRWNSHKARKRPNVNEVYHPFRGLDRAKMTGH